MLTFWTHFFFCVLSSLSDGWELKDCGMPLERNWLTEWKEKGGGNTILKPSRSPVLLIQ